MNTKIITAAFVFIFLLFQYVSMGAHQQSKPVPASGTAVPASQSGQPAKKGTDFFLILSVENPASQNQPDHESKGHHFHYERFSSHRKRRLVIILFKLLLLFAHICIILGVTLHCIH